MIDERELADISSRDDLVCQLELRCTQAEAALGEAMRREAYLEANILRFRELYKNSPVAFVTFDQSARIIEINPAACRLLEFSPAAALKLNFGALLADKAAVGFLDQLRRSRSSTETLVKTELELITGKQNCIPVQAVISKLAIGNGFLFEAALIDVSTQKAVAAAELRARELAEGIVATLPFPILVLDSQTRVLSANLCFYRFFQTSERQVINYHISELPEIEWQTKQMDRLLTEAMGGGRVVDDVIVRATLWRGSMVILQMSARRFAARNDGKPCLLVAFDDITRRKRAEEDREAVMRELENATAGLEIRVEERTRELEKSYGRLREVGEQLILAHESEQRRIARELHDQIGQDLTALKIMLGRGKNSNVDEARKTLAEAEALTQELLQTVRNICGTLRPQALDDLGLIAGLQWHIKMFAARAQLDITFDIGRFDESILSPIVKSSIFRVIQEALTNVSRHAETKTASVMLAMRNRQVEFSIRDGGCGFDPTGVRRGSTGISSMRERLSLVQGRFEICSSQGRGTIVTAQIPVQSKPTTKNGNGQTKKRNQHGKRTPDQNSGRGRSSSGAQGNQISSGQ